MEKGLNPKGYMVCKFALKVRWPYLVCSHADHSCGSDFLANLFFLEMKIKYEEPAMKQLSQMNRL